MFLFILYADLECLIERIDESKNNTGNHPLQK